MTASVSITRGSRTDKVRSFLFVLFAPVWLLTVSPSVFGQVTVIEGEEKEITTYHMTVSPSAEMEPAFKYRLLKHEDDRIKGNAAPFYYRAQLELDRISKAVRKQHGEDYDTWYSFDLPLSKLPKEKARQALSSYNGSVMGGLREATSREYCDWGWNLRDVQGPKVFSFLIPEIQQARELARMLSLQTRLALAEGRYQDAIEFSQMNYQIGQDIVTEPFLISGLVGIAITNITNANLLELIAAPDSPNLYWAFAELPNPMIDLRPAVRFELGNGPRVFPLLKDVESKNLTAGQWAVEVGDACAILFGDILSLTGSSSHRSDGKWLFDQFSPQHRGHLIGCGLGLLGYTTAKRALIESGLTRKDVESMPVGQVIAIQASRAYRHTAQEMEKLWYVPFVEAQRRNKEIEERLRSEGLLSGGLQSKQIIPIASLLLPAINACRRAQERLARDLAAMQVIEALRMHAAEAGHFPEMLDEVKIVPVPLNPATGKPFDYKLDGETAVLDLPDTEGIPAYYRYEISLRK